MNDLMTSIGNWYKVTLLSQRFPEAFSFKDKLFSFRAIRQHFAEKRFLKEKNVQIMVITRALFSVAVFKLIPNPPKSESLKVVAFINEAIEMDPDLFKSSNDFVRDSIAFLQEYGEESRPDSDSAKSAYIKDPVSDALAKELKDKGYTDDELNKMSEFAKSIAQSVHDRKE